ncbi:TerB N-terminal domain-containing protein [Limobrevibacterium gyesilva]|uniref:TerB N-terminal domain-containing protein n=1 Tax=Limobrevibacterium gyesilva TaxID=2991712 RepID=UPI0038CF8A41
MPRGESRGAFFFPDVGKLGLASGPTGYWPSYAGLAPAQRRSFLDWLAEGRRGPGIDIGYVLIFFNGLERRLFVDRAASEAPALIAEVERLLGLCSAHASFRSYATTFLAAARLVGGMPGVPEPEPRLTPSCRRQRHASPNFRRSVRLLSSVHLPGNCVRRSNSSVLDRKFATYANFRSRTLVACPIIQSALRDLARPFESWRRKSLQCWCSTR